MGNRNVDTRTKVTVVRTLLHCSLQYINQNPTCHGLDAEFVEACWSVDSLLGLKQDKVSNLCNNEKLPQVHLMLKNHLLPEL